VTGDEKKKTLGMPTFTERVLYWEGTSWYIVLRKQAKAGSWVV
jgi:hypothetical protein